MLEFTPAPLRILFSKTRQRSVTGLVLAAATFSLLFASPAFATDAPSHQPSNQTATKTPDNVGIRLTEVDAASASDPRARLYIIDRAAPGTTLKRTVEISNISNLAHTVGVYASGASIVSGAFIGSDGSTQNELSSWVSLSKPTLLLAAHGASKVIVTVKVPSDASEGERYGVIWAEVRSTATSGLIAVNRVGIRVYLSVGAGGAPRSSFEILTLAGTRDSDGTPVVEAQVANTGGRALDLSGQLSLADGPGGLNTGPFAATLGTTLAIGATEIVTIKLPKAITSGPWHVTLTLHSGLITAIGEATITFPEAGKNPPVETNRLMWWQVWLLPGLSMLLALVLATWFIWFFALKRRKHKKAEHRASKHRHTQ